MRANILLVFSSSVENEFWGHAGKQAVDEASDLSASYDLRIDEISMKLKDKVNDLRRVHTLLDVASQSDLIDADLFAETIQFILKPKLGRLILHAKIDRDHHGIRRQLCERLDTFLRSRVITAAVCFEERVMARVLLHHEVVISSLTTRHAALRVRRMREVTCHFLL